MTTSTCLLRFVIGAAVASFVGGCAGSPGTRPPAASSGPATGRMATAWRGWTAITAPEADSEQLECVRQVNSAATLARGADGRVSPAPASAHSERVAARLPFEPEGPLPGGPSSVRQVVSRSDGYFAAIDEGEWGGGLFWVPQDTRRAQRVDAPGRDAIRWIAELGFGTVAVCGMCHGDACASKARIFLVERAPVQPWRLKPLAELTGCPASVTIEPGAAALLLGTCGVLYRITPQALEPVARWNRALLPRDVQVAIEQGARVYYVNFGTIVARFEAAAPPTWLAPQDCAHFALDASGRCSCTASR